MQLQSIKSRIYDDIVRGSFDPGTRLTIDMLAGRYGSSHMPIREALRELAGEGLLQFERLLARLAASRMNDQEEDAAAVMKAHVIKAPYQILARVDRQLAQGRSA